jgi:hypothetical protein
VEKELNDLVINAPKRTIEYGMDCIRIFQLITAFGRRRSTRLIVSKTGDDLVFVYSRTCIWAVYSLNIRLRFEYSSKSFRLSTLDHVLPAH